MATRHQGGASASPAFPPMYATGRSPSPLSDATIPVEELKPRRGSAASPMQRRTKGISAQVEWNTFGESQQPNSERASPSLRQRHLRPPCASPGMAEPEAI